MTKRCPSCEKRKRRTSFYKHSKRADGLQSICKACSKVRRKSYYANGENKEKTVERSRLRRHKNAVAVFTFLKKKGCCESDCDEHNPILLEFDHVRGKKIAPVSWMVSQGYGLAKIKKEIEKCVVRCVRCHRLKTAKERGWYRWLEEQPL